MLVRPDASRGRRGGPLVGGIGVGVDEDDRERLGALASKARARHLHLGGIDGRSHGAVGQHAFVDFEAHVAVGRRA